jgi:hypothetical protein
LLAPTGEPVRSFWGREQSAALDELLAAAADLQKARSHQGRVRIAIRRRRALERIGGVLRRHAAVADVWSAYRGALRHVAVHRTCSVATPRIAQRDLHEEVREAGGPAFYFQIASRAASDPNRVVYECAAQLLSAVVESRPERFQTAIRQRARELLGELAEHAATLVSDEALARRHGDSRVTEDALREQVRAAARSLLGQAP